MKQVFLLFFLTSNAFAQSQSSTASVNKTLTLVSVEGESNKKYSMVTVKLTDTPKWKKVTVEEHGSFLQLSLPDVFVERPGEFYEGNSPVVKKIATFQMQDGSAGIRLFLEGDAVTAASASEVEILGQRILLTIDHSLISSSQSKTAAPANLPSSQSVPKSDVEKEKKATSDSKSNVKALFETVAWVCAGLMLLFLFFTYVRPRLKSSSSGLGDVDPNRIRSISNLAVSPKQKLSLIEVNGEKLLLGISADNINLIKSFDKPSPPKTAIQRVTQAKPSKAEPIAPPMLARPKPKLNSESPAAHEDKAAATEPKPAPRNMPTWGTDARLKSQESVDEVKTPYPKPKVSNQVIDDVTRLIREKIGNLPPI